MDGKSFDELAPLVMEERWVGSGCHGIEAEGIGAAETGFKIAKSDAETGSSNVATTA